MPVLTREQLKKQYRENKIAPVYLFFGEETYLRDLAVKTISDKIFAEGDLREFNESSISLVSSDLRDGLAAANQLPMMSQKRVVRITEVRVSDAGRKETIREEHEKALAAYLNDPAETSVIFFVADELDKRRKISKLLLDKCTAVEFAPLSDREVVDWLKDRLKDFNAKADDRTLQYLVATIGNDLRKVSSELEKLAVASLPDGIVTTDLIDELISNSRELSNFALTDHLLAKNRARALETVYKLLNDGAEPVMLLGLIASNYHRLALVKDLMKQGLDRKDVARAVNMPYSKQEEFMTAARRLEWEKLTHILRRMAEVDLAIKTSVATPRLQIEMLVCELTS
ncbi:MAG TPA: DNA polymerase III subunit delta [Pyrinomonadaceae bacterium]|jgi:DNA polymerase-3 subunit delta|nr:DNA polymerase III subunit delta [Pyrinomonadaceae bacterium]